MEKKITLRRPIEINGKKVTDLTYDAEEITNDMFLQACAQSAELSKTKTISLKVRENDYALHLYLGYMAIIAVNPDIDIMDLQRIKGEDLLQIVDIGLLFTLRKSEEPSEESNSDEQSGNTAELSSPVSGNSDNNESLTS